MVLTPETLHLAAIPTDQQRAPASLSVLMSPWQVHVICLPFVQPLWHVEITGAVLS